MLITFKYLITPGFGYKHYPSFDLFIQRKTFGWIWTEVEYVWSCLPGNLSENSGWVVVSEMSGGKSCFELCSRSSKVYGSGINPSYCKLYGISLSFNIGDENPAYLSYGGFNSNHLKRIEKDNNDVLANWKLVNAF
jgi:hypothetical protein